MKKNKEYDYYADGNRWSNSMFSELERNEVSFKEWVANGCPQYIKQTYANGQYLHSVMLELCRPYCTDCGDDDNVYVIKPTGLKLTTKNGKEQWAELTNCYEDGSYYIIEEYDKERIDNLCNQFFNEYLKEILENAQYVAAEMPYFADIEGLPCRAKLDLLVIDQMGVQTVLDWKSTSNYSEFRKKAYYYSYARQAYMYATISNSSSFTFIVFDTIDFNRWKSVDVDVNGKFFEKGKIDTERGIDMAKIFLFEGTSADIFKSETL